MSNIPATDVRPPRRFTLRVTTILVVLALVTTFWMVAEVLLQGTNCGGNSSTRVVCHRFVSLASEKARSHPGSRLSDLDRTEASQCFQSGFVAEEEFLIAPPVTVIAPSPRHLLVVCKTAFGNVPRPWIDLPFWRHRAHAVGYSNGEVELISPERYAQLDLRAFVPAHEWPER